MKIKKTTTWISDSCKSVDLEPPGDSYRLVNVTWKRKKQRSSVDGSKRDYTKITAYWARD